MKPSGRLSALLTERRVVLGVLAAFAIWSLVPLVPLLEAVNDRGGVLTGTTGSDAYNQFQYLAWMRDAGRHILISNPFGLTPVHHDFLQPMYVVSGLLNRAGLDIRYAYLIWRPVAIVVLVLSFALYTRRLMGESRMAWLAALLLALFYFTPLLTFLGRIGEFEWGGGFDLLIASREVSASRLTWGADHTAISVALMPLFLLSLERVLARGRLFGREVALAAALGLFTSWLHPAQGGTLFFIVVGLMIAGRLQRRYWSLLVPLAAAGAPLLYFKILTWTDAAWEIASQTSAYPHLPLLPLALGIGPLLLFSLLGLPRRFPASERERMLLIWPLAALIVYIVNEQFPPHAFNGLSLPLAILAVRGWSRLRLPALAGAAALAIAIVPAMTDPIGPLRRAVQYGGPLYLLTDDQYAGLKHMEGLPDGGVLARPQFSVVVPGFTGLPVWAGHDKWTPDGDERGAEADALFAGGLSDWKALSLVGRTGAAYAVADCDAAAGAKRVLRQVSSRSSRFGCLRVFELDPAAVASARTRAACAGLRRVRGPDGALRLEGKAVVTPRGRIAIRPDAMRGFVESAQAGDTDLTLSGWAVNSGDPASKPSVLVFANGVVVAAGRPDVERRDVAAANRGAPVRSGYHVALPAGDPEAAAECDSLRVVALSGSEGSELPLLRPGGG